MSDPEAARAAARRALFGDDGDATTVASADERDDADRAREGSGDDGERARDLAYLADRPPHHDRG